MLRAQTRRLHTPDLADATTGNLWDVRAVSQGAWLLVSAVLALAAFLLVHVALIVRVLRVTGITTGQRVMALVPFFNFVPAWKTDKKLHVVIGNCLFVLYVVLRWVL